ncbi:MAG: MMPL family transporter, partial [Bacilli bacterium]|nr:MMPL family transporter [Bacilli bacterium]
PVYYKLDESIPEDYGYTIATKALKEDFGMVSQEMVLVKKDMEDYRINEMVEKIKNVEGIDAVINPSSLVSLGITESMIPESIRSIYETEDYKMIIIASSYDIATTELNNQIEEVNKIIKSYDEEAILAGEGALMKDLVVTTDEDFHNVNYTSIGVIFVLMMVVLKSISLPVLLVTAIEFAIFINMGVPYFTGTEIPFIASVVIGTIQLGATIDYAILMTTKYLEERKNGYSKKEAVKISLDNSITSIFVSAMCFFGATIGVGIVSKIDMIGSLCTLIARGAIISMIVVMMVVPSILIIFDSLIMKTTLGMKTNKKGMKNMKNKKMKKAVAAALVLSTIMMPVSALALTKEETVYAKLNGDGSVKTVLVNEHLLNREHLDTIEDASDLEDILNINSNHTFTRKENLLTWESKGKDIFYQGTTKKETPVTEKITYQLDGEEV